MEQPASQHAQLQDIARRLLELDVSDDDLRNKIVALKGRATRALKTPVGNRNIHKARATAIANRQAKAKKFSQKIAAHIDRAKQDGCTSYADIARYLNENGLTTSRGSEWLSSSVALLLQKLERNQ